MFVLVFVFFFLVYCVSDKQCGTGASSWGLKEESPDLNGSCLLLEANRGVAVAECS